MQGWFGETHGLFDRCAGHADDQIAVLKHGLKSPSLHSQRQRSLSAEDPSLQMPANAAGQGLQCRILQAGDQGQIQAQIRIAGELLDQLQQQQQVLLQFRPATAGQQSDAATGGWQRISRRQHRVHERVADELHRALQLVCEVVRRELIPAEHRLETTGGEQFAAGPGQAQPPLVVA